MKRKFETITSSLVAIFDIEDFSIKTPEGMAALVNDFLENLSTEANNIKDLNPDTFSTGDGAIISIGRDCDIDASSIERFINFSIEFMKKVTSAGISIRTAINHSMGDRIVYGKGIVLKDQYIQVGDSINIASRILSFCEPKELMIHESVHGLLRTHNLVENFNFKKNDVLITKHGFRLITHTYIPKDDEKEESSFYSPHSPLHEYKRFSAFPPIKANTLNYFMENGLNKLLKKTIENSYDAIRSINETKTFITSMDVLAVLTNRSYDPEDDVYVMWRKDHSSHFWTQYRSEAYLRFLSANAKKYGSGFINQKRIMFFNESMLRPTELMPENDIYFNLLELHKTNTFFALDAELLNAYDKSAELLFGYTLSTKNKYAIIPIPAADIDAHELRTDNFGVLLRRLEMYEQADGPMKAIITADTEFIEKLIDEFEAMLQDPVKELRK